MARTEDKTYSSAMALCVRSSRSLASNSWVLLKPNDFSQAAKNTLILSWKKEYLTSDVNGGSWSLRKINMKYTVLY